nr:diguanylate cyclase [uncultured Duganella sp.]
MTMPPRHRATRPRLTTLVTVGASATLLLTVLSLLVLVDHFAYGYAEREAGQRLQQLAWQTRDALDRMVARAGADVRLLSGLPQVRDARSPDEIRAVLESLQKTTPDYAWIGLAGPDGRVVAATDGLLEGVDVGARDWFKGGRDKRFAGDFHPATLLGKKLPASADPWRFVDAAGPVTGADGTARGVLCVHMSWGWARRMAGTLLAPAGQAYAAEILVVRADGTVILGPRGMEERRLADTNQTLALARAGGSGALRQTWDDGRSYLGGYALTGTPGDPATLAWAVIARQPVDMALAAARRLERQILLLGAILGLAMAAAAAVVARRYTRPLNALSRDIELRSAAAPGAAGVPDIVPVDGFHELQVLSGALARLLANEQGHLAALRALNEQLESTVAERTGEIGRKAQQLERALAREQSTQRLLQERATELRAILDNAHDAFIALDPDGVVMDWNRQAEKLLGWRRAEVVGQPLAAMVLPLPLRRVYERDMRQLAATRAAGGLRGANEAAVLDRRVELTLRNRDGRELPVEISLAYVPRGAGHLFIAFLHDIGARKKLFASMEAMALRDTLTGLPNRRALLQTLGEALLRANRQRQCCAVFFLDLDRFKQINDRHGHDEGDELLRQFAERVRQAMRRTDTVGRLAGDEFIVIVEMLRNDAEARETADKLLAALARPFALKTVTVQLGASVGVAVHHPDDPQDIETLLSRADRAMYADKQRGRRQLAPH